MSQTLELPDDLYGALQEAAEASGTTPLGWIAAHLPNGQDPARTAGPQTLAELFAGRVGRIRSGSQETLSEACGEKFTTHL